MLRVFLIPRTYVSVAVAVDRCCTRAICLPFGLGMLTPLCCPPQILEFGLYEFVPTEDNPGGVRKMKAGTEVGTLAKPLLNPINIAPPNLSSHRFRPGMRLVHCQVAIRV